MKQTPKEILATMLGELGFPCEIEEMETFQGLKLQVTPVAAAVAERDNDQSLLIGPEGKRIEDLQYLLNRILQAQDPVSPKVQVDVAHFRDRRNELLIAQALRHAESVRQTGEPFFLDPMNAYDRRLIHNAFKDDPQIATWSPSDDARVKRIMLKRK